MFVKKIGVGVGLTYRALYRSSVLYGSFIAPPWPHKNAAASPVVMRDTKSAGSRNDASNPPRFNCCVMIGATGVADGCCGNVTIWKVIVLPVESTHSPSPFFV